MVKHATFLIVLLNICNTTDAQEVLSVHLNAWFNYRLTTNELIFDPGMNGAALSAGMYIPLSNSWNTAVAAEFGAAGSGNYTALSAGFQKMVSLKIPGMVFCPEMNILQGMALFRPSSIYMLGLEQVNFFGFNFRNGSRAGLILGLRYYGFPGYASFSNIYDFLDIKTGIRYQFGNQL